jgi:nitroreductase
MLALSPAYVQCSRFAGRFAFFVDNPFPIVLACRKEPSLVDIYEVLYTTRAMRRLKPDPIPHDVQARILDAAIRAPSGGNTQRWRFVLVDDPSLRDQIGPLYRACVEQLWSSPAYAQRIAAAEAAPDDPDSVGMLRMQHSAQYLADHFEEVPLLLFAFAQSDPSGGSIYPAIWSAMLAARAEGVGTTLTTILRFRQDEVYRLLGVPEGQGWEMAGCITMGYPLGRWGVAARRPVDRIAGRNGWNEPLGFSVPDPLWPGSAS